MTSRCLFPFVGMIRSLGKQHSAVGARSSGRQRLWQALYAHGFGLRRLIPVATPAPSWHVIRSRMTYMSGFDSRSLLLFTVHNAEEGAWAKQPA